MRRVKTNIYIPIQTDVVNSFDDCDLCDGGKNTSFKSQNTAIIASEEAQIDSCVFRGGFQRFKPP